MLTSPYVNNPNKHNILCEKGRRNLHAFVRKAEKNLYAFSPLQIMQAPTWSPLELLNSNRLCWSHIKSQNTSLLQIMQHTICTLCQIAEI